jgi:hypothetical protein
MVSQTFAWKPNGFVDFLGNYTWRNSDDYRNGDHERIANTDVDAHNGLVKLGINPAEGHRLQLSGILFSDDEDILATDVNNANAEYMAWHRIRKNTASAHYTFDSPTSDLVNLSATVYRDQTKVTDTGKDYSRDQQGGDRHHRRRHLQHLRVRHPAGRSTPSPSAPSTTTMPAKAGSTARRKARIRTRSRMWSASMRNTA